MPLWLVLGEREKAQQMTEVSTEERQGEKALGILFCSLFRLTS